MRKTVIGYCNEHQARRSADGYDTGVVRVNVYGPDQHAGDPDYDKPATVTIHEGPHERMFTETQVKAILERCLHNTGFLTPEGAFEFVTKLAIENGIRLESIT